MMIYPMPPPSWAIAQNEPTSPLPERSGAARESAGLARSADRLRPKIVK